MATSEAARSSLSGVTTPPRHLAINPAARRLYERRGFVVEGRLRDAYRDGDGWCDAIVMALLEEQYRATRAR